jgi:hypothetical protein
VDEEFESFLIDNGFFKTSMPDNNVVSSMGWSTPEEFYQTLSKNSKIHFRKHVRRYLDKYEVEVAHLPTETEIDHWYSLYENVKNNSLELNTFTLPRKLFANIARNASWETLVLKLKTGEEPGKTVAVVFSHIGGENHIPMIIGIDYTYNEDYKVYRQALYQVMMRAGELGKKKVLLGFSAPIEKKKVGAALSSTYAFMQIRDNYNAETLAMMSLTSANLTK